MDLWQGEGVGVAEGSVGWGSPRPQHYRLGLRSKTQEVGTFWMEAMAKFQSSETGEELKPRRHTQTLLCRGALWESEKSSAFRNLSEKPETCAGV